MIHFGTVRPGTTLYIPFATYDSNDPSASVTLTGLATSDIEIYKNGSATQRSSDAGYTLLDTDGIDFDGVTGIHGFSVDLADDTDAGFFVAGAQYTVVVSSVTVDAATINFIAATFRIGYQSAYIDTTIATLASQTSFTLTAGPAEDDAINGMVLLIHDKASAVQVTRVVVEDYTGSTKTVTLRAAPAASFTIAAGDNVSAIGFDKVDVTHWIGTAAATPSVAGVPEVDVTHFNGTAGTFASGRPEVNTTHFAGQTITCSGGVTVPAETLASTTNITAGTITTVTNLTNAPTTGDFTATMKTSIGTAVAASAVASVTGNVGGNVTGSVGSIATGGIAAASFAAGAIDAAAIAANAIGASELAADAVTEIGAGVLSALGTGTWATAIPWNASWDAEVQSEAEDALVANHLDHLLAATYDPASKPGAADALLNELVESDSGVARFTANSLEQAPSGGASSDCDFEGFVTKSGSTYYVSFVCRQSGAVVAGASLSSLVCSFYDEDGTDLTFSGTPTAASSGIVYASGSLTTAITDNRPVMVKVGATIGGTAYSSYLAGANLA